MHVLLWLFRGALLLAFALFMVQNLSIHSVRFMNASLSLPMAAWALVFFLIGALFGASLLLPRVWRAYRAQRQELSQRSKVPSPSLTPLDPVQPK